MARGPKIGGIDVVQRVFNRLPRQSLERITHALNQGADEIVALQKSLAVQSKPLAGAEHMADTVRRTPIRTLRGDTSAAVFIFAGRSEETQDAAFRTEYGREADDEGHPGHDPQPFFRPGYWAKRKRIRDRVKREIKRAARFAAGARSKA